MPQSISRKLTVRFTERAVTGRYRYLRAGAPKFFESSVLPKENLAA